MSQNSCIKLFFYCLNYCLSFYVDVDEFIVANPSKYPHDGLSNYLVDFNNNTELLHTRAIGYDICHVSEVSDSHPNNPPLESTLKWNESILSQRNFWLRHPRYDKPILSKVLIRYKPGQHTAYLPSFISQDENLFLLHMQYVDKEYCMMREEHKYNLALQMPNLDRSLGFNIHIFQYPQLLKSGKLCKQARASYDEDSELAFDSGGERLEKIPAAFHNVTI